MTAELEGSIVKSLIKKYERGRSRRICNNEIEEESVRITITPDQPQSQTAGDIDRDRYHLHVTYYIYDLAYIQDIQDIKKGTEGVSSLPWFSDEDFDDLGTKLSSVCHIHTYVHT